MDIKKIISLSSLLSISCLSHAQTLPEAIQQAIHENPSIQSLRSEQTAITHEIDQAKAGYLPTVDMAIGVGWNSQIKDNASHSEEASIALKQMIFDGMTTYHETERHRKRADAKAYTVFRQTEIIALNVTEAYINVLRSQALLALAKDNLLEHKRTDDQIQLRASRGIGKKAEAAQSSGRLALAEKNTLSEVGNLKDAQTNFLSLVGTLPIKLSTPPYPTDALPKSLKAALKTALDNHPTLKSANADIESAFEQHQTAKAAYMPRIDVEVGVSHTNINDDAYAMLRMNYNLYNGGKDLARRQQTSAQINQAKEIRDSTYRQVIESMRLSWVAYQTLQRQMNFFERHKDSSIISNTAYKKQFNIGQRTLLDLLDSANEMFTTKSAYTNAKYDTLYAQYRILSSQGSLNQYIGATLPTEALTIAQLTSKTPDDKNPELLASSDNQTYAIKNTVTQCYPLFKHDNEEVAAQQKIAMQAIAEKNYYQLDFADQTEYYVDNYLVLTAANESLRSANKVEKLLRKQKFKDIWLFKEGDFQWQISLGVFSSEENAIAAKETFSKLTTQALEVTAQYKIRNISALKVNLLEEEIELFERDFSRYINKEQECSEE